MGLDPLAKHRGGKEKMSMKKFTCIFMLTNLFWLTIVIYIGGCRTDYLKRVFSRVVGRVYVPSRSDSDCVASWNSSIRKLNLDVDVVFFGNSITEGGEWQSYFPDYETITLAYIGEDTKGMLRRVSTLAQVKPEKVFVMAGVNGLQNQSLSDFEFWYEVLIDSISKTVPQAEIYLESILPVAATSNFCSNDKIQVANAYIKDLVTSKASLPLRYVDLWAVYEQNCSMPDEFTYDGVHLRPEAYSFWVSAIQKYIEE